MSIKNFKFRVYPNKEQKERIDFLFGSCRFIHNRFLSEHKELLIKYKETKDKVYKYRMSVKNQEEKLSECRDFKKKLSFEKILFSTDRQLTTLFT